MRLTDPRLTQGGLAAAALALFVVSWQHGYVPSAQAFRQTHERAATLTNRVAQIEAMLQAAGGQAVWLAQRQQELQRLKGRVPPQAQLPQALNALVEAVRAGDIKLVNITQGSLEPAQEAGRPLMFEGAPCVSLPVTVTAESRYLPLMAVLEQITSAAFPVAVGVGRVELQLRDSSSSRLNATLQLYLYVTGSLSSPSVPSAQMASPDA